MFVGHIAVGLASKRLAPRAPFVLVFGAPLFLDLLWPVFLSLGWEQVAIEPGATPFTPLDFISYPWSHSLVMSLFWGALLGAITWTVTRERTAALVVGSGVVSHWVLDWVTHRPDLPLAPTGAIRVGLGLWNSIPGTLIVEGALFVLGIWFYLRTTRPRDAVGRWAFWALMALSAVMWVPFSPPPPNAKALTTLAYVGWLVPLWGAWFDRHRDVVAG
ncbi:MAG: metal-dependent hydrolase [Gemmatimonadota bacterium]